MNRVNETVKLLVEQNPLYIMMLRSNVVNFTNLARLLKPSVQGIVGKEVKINTIVKGLTGIAPSETQEHQLDFLRKSNLSLEYRYDEKIFEERPTLKNNTVLLYKTGERWKVLSRDVVSGDLALIRIQLPEEAAGEPGLTLFVVEYLMMQRVEVEKIYRFDTEILLVCNQNKADIIVRYLSDLIFKSHL